VWGVCASGPAPDSAGPVTTTRLLVIQHHDIAGLGRARPHLQAAGLTLDVRAVYRGEDLPADLSGHDGLLVLGGPQTAYTDTGFPTRSAEIALAADAVRAEVPYLGICLGAQLLAQAAGGRGYRGQTPEVGWHPVRLTSAAGSDPLLTGLPQEWMVMQSHVDHFTLPPEARVLATGKAYPNQAFRVGPRAWGVQFHPEAGPGFIAARQSMIPGYGADAPTPPAGERAALSEVEPLVTALFTRFARLVGRSAGTR